MLFQRILSWCGLLCLLTLAALLVVPSVAQGGGPVLNPANGHYYEAVAVPGNGINWYDAAAAAQSRSYHGMAGSLVCITSAVENQWVVSTFPDAVPGGYWLGGHQAPNSPEPAGGWSWVSGEAWSYTSWNPGEPNNLGGVEDSLLFLSTGHGTWNDDKGTALRPGYVVEYGSPTPPPNPISFLPPANYPSSAQPGWVHLVDVDNDGKLDAVVGGGALTVHYGLGDGTFEPGVTLLTSSTVQQDAFSEVTSADVNQDGRPDLIVSDAYGNRVLVLVNQGNRVFAQPVAYAVDPKPYGVVAGDFNGDGYPDLAVSNNNGADMTVLLNRGNGTFGSRVDYPGGSYPGRVIAADFNRDGKLDLAMCNYVSADVYIYRGDGHGAFTQQARYPVGNYAAQVVTADFNRDGKLDLATANTFDHTITILYGQGDGTFQVGPTYKDGPYPHIMQPVDLDGDGWPDLAVPNNSTNHFTVLRNLGDGTFGVPVAYTSGGDNVRYVDAGDLDGDGKPDVVVANTDSGTISVFINTTGPPKAPSNLTATVSGATAITLAWTDESNNESGFKIERDSGSGYVQIGTVGADVTTFQDGNAPAGTAYSYRVRATNGSGDSAPCAPVTVPAIRIAQPTSLTATARYANGQLRVDLSWTAGDGAAANFEVQKASGGAFTAIGTIPAAQTTYSDTGVQVGQALQYQVIATTSAGRSAPSNVASLTVAIPAPPVPQHLRTTLDSMTEVDLAWDAVPEADYWVLERAVGTGTFQSLANPAATTPAYADTTVQPASTYHYRLKATNPGGASDYTPELVVTTPPPPPGSPTGFHVTGLTAHSVTLAWTLPVGPLTGLTLERSTDSGASFQVLATLPGTASSYADTGAQPGVTYTYQVKATNAGGDSGYAGPVQAQIPVGGVLKISPASLNFGTIRRGVTRKITLKLTNKGKGPLAVTVGTLPAPFRVTGGGGAAMLAPKKTRSVTVEFAPAAALSYGATLTITSTDPTAASTPVSTTGRGK